MRTTRQKAHRLAVPLAIASAMLSVALHGQWEVGMDDALQDVSYDGILRCYEEAKELLGVYPINLVSVHDPDEYLFHAEAPRDRERRDKNVLCDLSLSAPLREIKDAYRALFELKARGEVEAVGIGSKDWRAIEMLWRGGVRFDWAMFACQPTLLVHPPELISFVNELKAAGVTLIDSAVFNGGFLLGSDMLDYRKADPEKDAAAFAFREHYLELCRCYGLDPAVPAVQYAYRLGFDSVALNTSSPKRIRKNASYASALVPDGFWREIEDWSV